MFKADTCYSGRRAEILVRMFVYWRINAVLLSQLLPNDFFPLAWSPSSCFALLFRKQCAPRVTVIFNLKCIKYNAMHNCVSLVKANA